MMASKLECKQCKEWFRREAMIKLPRGRFCTMDHAVLFAQSAQKKKAERDKAKRDKQLRQQHREQKEAIKTDRQLQAEAQASFNKWIRARDYFEPCISCGKSKEEIEATQGWKVGGCWDAGHFKSRGAKPQLRFNVFNVHKQCKSCNGGGGKFSAKAATVDAQYEVNLIAKIGQEKVDWLKNNNDIRKFDADYYRRIKRIFNKKYRVQVKRNEKTKGAS